MATELTKVPRIRPPETRRRTPFNPLACSDTVMRPNTLLMAKLSWVLLALGGFGKDLLGPLTPAVGLFSSIPGETTVLSLVFWLGGLALLCNRAVRIACVSVGGVVLLAPYESLTAWHPYAWVGGGVLFLCAFQGAAETPRFVRAFVILVHAAALLGAWSGATWVDQALAAPWIESPYLGAIPRWFAGHLPEGALQSGLTWFTIAVCTFIPFGLLFRATRRASAALAVAFYAILHLSVGGTEVALFTGALCIAQISFVEWPRYTVVVWPRSCGWPLWLRVALDRYDFEHRTDWPRPEDPDAELEVWLDHRPMTGARAIADLVLTFPAFYFAVLLFCALCLIVLPQAVAVQVTSGLALALVGFSVVASLSRWRTRFSKSPPRATPPAATPPEAKPADIDVSGEKSAPSDVTIEIDTPPRPDR